jgi:HD-like signal output (HDOD) protein
MNSHEAQIAWRGFMAQKTRKQTGLQECCRSRLASIVSAGLAPLPACLFDLDVLLTAPVVDLKKVTSVLGSDNELSQRVLRLSNASLSQPGDVAQNISDAVVLLGPSLFHAAVLITAVTDFGPREFRDENAWAIWTHSVLMAALSEKIAEISEYPVRGKAFLAGLLHDIGLLPFLMVEREEIGVRDDLAPIQWRDNIKLEREIFGLDHCEIGRWMGRSWNFSPILMDAVQHHHNPRKAMQDSHLAEVVCAAEYFCSGTFASRNEESTWNTAEFVVGSQPSNQIHSRLNLGSKPSLVWPVDANDERRGGKRYWN